ncbi:MAG TPA: hypothetical protein VFS88_05020 [Micavibrio sp.]|nr:hypothetical protein [Micavibrio sp.]
MISRILFVSLLFLLLHAPTNAAAQMKVEPSDKEDVAIAFFKTAGINPDFEKWAKGSQEFKTIASARVPEFLYDEKQRLLREWKKYDAQDPIIDVKATIHLEIKTMQDQEGEESYWMYISFGRDDAVYFPYEYQEYKIAVIPQMIETLMIQPLQKEQYQMILQDMEGKRTGDAVIFLQLKPVKAYVHQPYKIDNQDQWALLTDIATMSVKSWKTGSPLWNYSADWYTSPVTQELKDLYQAPSAAN